MFVPMSPPLSDKSLKIPSWGLGADDETDRGGFSWVGRVGDDNVEPKTITNDDASTLAPRPGIEILSQITVRSMEATDLIDIRIARLVQRYRASKPHNRPLRHHGHNENLLRVRTAREQKIEHLPYKDSSRCGFLLTRFVLYWNAYKPSHDNTVRFPSVGAWLKHNPGDILNASFPV
ncbi:uncharacterized protein LACBIDRAFT_326319 [Laccaria bicolor S238N-H82]|uniref:Predicted protein n=1 Tax=Laccaria bicolor (strain S238N-H82 / ATCC MYA-4686) TaxID=486041 RepID=B0D815_LACBS|nr:uncharacterized protein LACBIDRAFT_326319 [Laccaria bicolor S238N-H82]EDR09741.1 predicted protein [Laccaria bicolor S238N-H82]|eukprot:XP_001880090.1 predicted protein [Laccaria bicolor S238N-H82]